MLTSDNLLFISRYLKNPTSVGSIAPSSMWLAKAIRSVTEQLERVPILELGPGTGTITKELVHCNPTLIEIDDALCSSLRKKFPDLTVLNACALETLKNLDHPVGLVISIPLINNPLRNNLISVINKQYAAGKIKWCVIFTYGHKSPLAGTHFQRGKRAKFCLLNVPPASVWAYH